MKNTSFKIGLVSILTLLVFKQVCKSQSLRDEHTGYLTYPFSQLVVRNDWAAPIVWKYMPYKDIPETETVIAPPEITEDWHNWYKKMKAYQLYLRGHLNDTASSYLEVKVKKGSNVRLTYKRVLNAIRLRPGDKIIFEGTAKTDRGFGRFMVSLIFIKIGQELSNNTVQSRIADSVIVSENITSLHSEIIIPEFDSKNLMVQPAIFFETDNSGTVKIEVYGLQLSIPHSQANFKVYNELQPTFYPKNTGVDKQLYNRAETQWIKQNFISGFVFLWDSDFWDAGKKGFTVQRYCNKMKREFGGFQSILIWIGYPNIGVDDRNIWDIIEAIPGGINGLREVISVFHKNKVKVYFPYMPWEIDTRRTNIADAKHWGQILGKTDADGLFFDTWFDGDSFQKELDKYKKGASIGTEHHPTLQNVQGYNAITTSWGQTLMPYDNNGISRVKWLVPEHLQWTISRWETNRQNTMAYSWINGQGILVWENIFGHMNTWDAKDRQTLRKMNAIYQQFGYLYTSDSWKPYLPTGNAQVHISSWQNSEARIWNIVADKEDIVTGFYLPVDDEKMEYYDLWTGDKLSVIAKKIALPLKRFSCVLGLKKNLSASIANLLNKQRAETAKPLPANDLHRELISAKAAKSIPAMGSALVKMPDNLLPVKAGVHTLQTKHVKRECGCFPDVGAKNNNDYTIEKNAAGAELIVHQTKIALPAFQIMTNVITNEAFYIFLKSAKYMPADTINFLKHWNGDVFHDSLKDKPVVYVSLDDARAYARWAGMRLPTEWEWQAAGEAYANEFIFNDVWEWNESERYDGHNHFVSLRGGCRNWALQTSRWYFPGTPGSKTPGGAQLLDSHSKFFILKTGFDRAGTIGFRCVKP